MTANYIRLLRLQMTTVATVANVVKVVVYEGTCQTIVAHYCRLLHIQKRIYEPKFTFVLNLRYVEIIETLLNKR